METGKPDGAKAPDYKESTATPAKARRQSEGAPAPVIPDCCNEGVALRAVLLVNAGALTLAIAQASDFRSIWSAFLGIALIVEPVLLLSLLLLCLIRKWANGLPLRWQWVIGVGLPTLLCGLAVAVVMQRWATPADAGYEPIWWVSSRMLVAALATAATLEYFRLRARAYAPSFSEARLQALQARIRPHFLFNSLNTVLGLIRSDPRRAEHTLENLADLFRVFMRDARDLVPLDDEVLTCKEYLAIEQLRLSNRLKVVWEIDDMPGDALLPSLLLQPLLENAVHHGIEPRTEEGVLFIRISRPGERVRVEIENPLSATPATRPGNQMALSNVRERLMLLYDMEAELKNGPEGDRYRLYLEFPYRKERRRRDVRRHFNPDR